MDPLSVAVVTGVSVIVVLANRPSCNCGADEQVLELLRAQLSRCGPENLDRQGAHLSSYLLGAALGASLGVIAGVFVSIRFLLPGRGATGQASSGVSQVVREPAEASAILEGDVRESALRALSQLRARGAGPRALER
eukprot:6491187-Amphidinium_carterae.1